MLRALLAGWLTSSVLDVRLGKRTLHCLVFSLLRDQSRTATSTTPLLHIVWVTVAALPSCASGHIAASGRSTELERTLADKCGCTCDTDVWIDRTAIESPRPEVPRRNCTSYSVSYCVAHIGAWTGSSVGPCLEVAGIELSLDLADDPGISYMMLKGILVVWRYVSAGAAHVFEYKH